jgi:hypothetical protein
MKHAQPKTFLLITFLLLSNLILCMEPDPAQIKRIIADNRSQLGDGLMIFNVAMIKQALNNQHGIGNIDDIFFISPQQKDSMLINDDELELESNGYEVHHGHILEHYMYIISSHVQSDSYTTKRKVLHKNALPILTLLLIKGANPNIQLIEEQTPLQKLNDFEPLDERSKQLCLSIKKAFVQGGALDYKKD